MDAPMPRLFPKSYKGLYPFRLAATSFVFPADYVPNVQRLAPFFDAVELLCFESEALPSGGCIRELAGLAREFALDYNIHLPADLSFGDADPHRQRRDLETLLRAIERLAPLSPSTWTLHISRELSDSRPEALVGWKQKVHESLFRLIRSVDDPARFSVENLDYPFEEVADIVESLGLSVCLDVGHLLRDGHEIAGFFSRHRPRISIIHLHAAENGRDHLSLDRLPPPAEQTILKLLAGYKGIVSLEVFSFDALAASLRWLEARLEI